VHPRLFSQADVEEFAVADACALAVHVPDPPSRPAPSSMSLSTSPTTTYRSCPDRNSSMTRSKSTSARTTWPDPDSPLPALVDAEGEVDARALGALERGWLEERPPAAVEPVDTVVV
jgi:hypothetical protein